MIDISQTYFGKELSELKYKDIHDFFSENKKETNRIEFKSFHPKHGNFNKNIEGIIRSIVAFLNSDGGILIWGAPQKKEIDGEEIFQGDLSPLKELKEKDSIISKISDSITPLPVGIKVNILEKDSNYLYIFEVQQSNYSPHQYNDKYYCRLDGQTKPAPHYLVEALFKKIKFPNIEAYINIDEFGIWEKNEKLSFLDISILLFNFSHLQNEHNITYRIYCPQAVFEESLQPIHSVDYEEDGHLFNSHNISTLHYGMPEKNPERLIFNWEELAEKNNNEIELFLYFGGKQSPLKLSEYTLSLNGSISKFNPKIIKVKRENIMLAEEHSRIGQTRETMLRKTLNR
ncbi:ATP-binding protein [Christiangramia sp. ASW11-125]|uniref:ATP-binding protein n=1 Tax=Christiangramia sp. ASW11-125 TaxID=3400701 RepID=UPI003AB0E4B2